MKGCKNKKVILAVSTENRVKSFCKYDKIELKTNDKYVSGSNTDKSNNIFEAKVSLSYK